MEKIRPAHQRFASAPLIFVEIDKKSALLGQKLRELERKAVRSVEAPCNVAGQLFCTLRQLLDRSM